MCFIDQYLINNKDLCRMFALVVNTVESFKILGRNFHGLTMGLAAQ